MTRPYFFVFDGVDGAGKTTQISRFRTWLESQGHATHVCRDPGTSELGERIRALLLQSTDVPIGNRAEMLLYMAARAQLVEEVIRPALEQGRTVISDRYLLANVVYQGHAGDLTPEIVWQVGQVATGGLQPSLTFVLDLDPATAADRRQGPADRLEQRGIGYFQRVRRGFLAESQRAEAAIAVIDASRDVDAVERAVRDAAQRVMTPLPEPN